MFYDGSSLIYDISWGKWYLLITDWARVDALELFIPGSNIVSDCFISESEASAESPDALIDLIML